MEDKRGKDSLQTMVKIREAVPPLDEFKKAPSTDEITVEWIQEGLGARETTFLTQQV